MAPFPIWLLYTDLGSPNFGGGISTASGLYFIGAAMDKGFRAFDTETGEELWHTRLPYAANSVPMSFRFEGGKQYVVVAAGGNPLSDMGSTVLAFTLPD